MTIKKAFKMNIKIIHLKCESCGCIQRKKRKLKKNYIDAIKMRSTLVLNTMST